MLCATDDDDDDDDDSLYVAEVTGGDYPEHMCSQVARPGLTETPPDLHQPTPGPHKSIFHEMMVR